MNGERPRPGPVVVTGMGLKAPGGLTTDELWHDLYAARSHAEPYTDERLPENSAVLVTRVIGFDATAYLAPADVRRLDRSHHLAVGAAQDTMDMVRGRLPPPERRAVVVGVGQGASATYEEQHTRLLTQGLRGLSPLALPVVMAGSVAAQLSMRFGHQGPCLTVSTACASGATAIGEAVELLRCGAADLVLAGGVDAMVTYNVICSFLRLDAMSRNVADPARASRPFDVHRDGFVLGEGAGFVVLERQRDATAAGRASLGAVLGYGSTADAHHIVAPAPDGRGAYRCMAGALADAGVTPADITHVNAHGTSTVLNDRAEATALTRVFGPHTPPVTAVKGATGHLIGASGAVECIVSIMSAQRRVAPPISGLGTPDSDLAIDAIVGVPRSLRDGPVLSNSFGFGGVNASLVVSA